MATYLQQNLHFNPCQQSVVKKSFEQVLKEIGAKKKPDYGQQCWQLKQDVIFYSARNTKTGVTLVYKIYEETDFFEEKAQRLCSLINEKVKETFPPQKEATEQLSLRSNKFAAYTIGEDVVNNGGGSFFNNIPKWTWWVLGIGLFVLFDLGILGKSCSSGGSSDSSSSYNVTAFTSRLDVLHFIDGESFYTPLGSLYVENGKAYDGSGAYVNDIIIDSYNANSAIIEVYPAQWSGSSMKFKVDRKTRTISYIK